MHILVATSETQGQRADDFNWTVDGELVRFAFDACDRSDCGCDRAFAGLASSKASTTALVLDHPAFDPVTYRTALLDGLVRQGFVRPGDPHAEAFVSDLADRQLSAARALPAGTVVEIREGLLCVRDPVP